MLPLVIHKSHTFRDLSLSLFLSLSLSLSLFLSLFLSALLCSALYAGQPAHPDSNFKAIVPVGRELPTYTRYLVVARVVCLPTYTYYREIYMLSP
ncbi:hypothetical protein GGS21DRAFT_105097 [Xylaria nigripes]|nr:hypothetical protein GGS21DRAFT_105097 [Xylaria nigripes]